jgi:hypothetical protein
MGNILTHGESTLAEEYEAQTFGGNRMWADPVEAREVGARILSQLCERHGVEDQRSETPEMPADVLKILADALEAIDDAALPTERRANILHGLVDAAAKAGVLGGEAEWAPAPRTSLK